MATNKAATLLILRRSYENAPLLTEGKKRDRHCRQYGHRTIDFRSNGREISRLLLIFCIHTERSSRRSSADAAMGSRAPIFHIELPKYSLTYPQRGRRETEGEGAVPNSLPDAVHRPELIDRAAARCAKSRGFDLHQTLLQSACLLCENLDQFYESHRRRRWGLIVGACQLTAETGEWTSA